jgi:aspartate racemase
MDATRAPHRTVGLLGGVGPEATLDYYRRFIDRWRERGPDRSYPTVLISSLDAADLIHRLIAGDRQPTVDAFRRGIEQLAAAGAGLGMIGSVLMHTVYDEVAPAAPIPMLSILDALVAAAKSAGIRRPGALGARPTVEGEFFGRPFEAAGIELVRPDEAERAWVHEVYMSELVKGVFNDETRWRLESVIAALRERRDIDAIILAGTELPVILREPMYAGVPVLNATAIHVEAAIDWLLAGEREVVA